MTAMCLVILIKCETAYKASGMLGIKRGMSVEGRKKDKRTWTDEETGNVNADHVAGRVRLQAMREENEWLEQVDW